jgi:hypothetical protein
MQQRRLRLGDILDDYCPRERRITNHAVVAMIDDEVKQTRCTTCEADHEYKQAKIPPARRKKTDAVTDSPEGMLRPRPAAEPLPVDEAVEIAAAAPESFETPSRPAHVEPEPDAQSAPAVTAEDEGPVHRRLIRATLPRPEGQVPDRKGPEFMIRQPGGFGGRQFDGNKNGHRQGRRPMRAPGGSSGQPPRFGGPRQGSGQGSRHGSGQGQRSTGNRAGQPGNQRGGRSGPGQGHGRGGGRRRGR